jgi:ubiquinone/menaquinone biosynthesis C-methylase UbiE
MTRPRDDDDKDDDKDDDATRLDDRERVLTAHISERLLTAAGIDRGHRVLDVACGRGEPALRAAHRVGPTGRVVAVDKDPVVVRVCAARAAAQGLLHVDARVCAAAAVDQDLGSFDVVTCRFGLMYVATPVLALQRMRRVVVDGGRVAVALWGPRDRIAWWRVPRETTERFARLPPTDGDVPWAGRYGDVDVFARDAAAAGLVIDTVEFVDTDVVRGTAVDVVAWVEHVFGAWVALVPDRDREAWRAVLFDALRAHGADDDVALGGTVAVVTARPA